MTLRNRLTFITGVILATLINTQTVQAQAPAGRPAPPAPVPLLFKETWKLLPESVTLTTEHVTNPALQMTLYGKDHELSPASGTPHIWTGVCNPACGVGLKLKDSYADLSGRAHIMWHSRTSGYHQIRPLLKLADGRLVVGDFADENPYEYRQVDFNLAQMRWLLLEPTALVTKGVFLTDVDLSKVDEVGFIDLTPGSGHGFGGYSTVGNFEVYGKPVPRSGK